MTVRPRLGIIVWEGIFFLFFLPLLIHSVFICTSFYAVGVNFKTWYWCPQIPLKLKQSPESLGRLSKPRSCNSSFFWDKPTQHFWVRRSGWGPIYGGFAFMTSSLFWWCYQYWGTHGNNICSSAFLPPALSLLFPSSGEGTCVEGSPRCQYPPEEMDAWASLSILPHLQVVMQSNL